MLEHLGKGKIFTSLDLRSAYTNAFTFKLGYFEYTVMLFGLKNTPAVCEYNVLILKFIFFFFFVMLMMSREKMVISFYIVIIINY